MASGWRAGAGRRRRHPGEPSPPLASSSVVIRSVQGVGRSLGESLVPMVARSCT